jgi:RecB family exonuclease
MIDATPALGATLSPSQVRSFMDCQARWWFKYGLQQPDPTTGSMAFGRAVHAALTQNFAQKTESYEDLPITGVLALFREAWALECQHTEFRDDEDPTQLAREGEALVTKYMDEVAPGVEPAAVELRVEGEIAGVRVQGWIDVLDVEGRIIDLKTAKVSPSGIEPMTKFQVATYRHLTPGAAGTGRVDTLVRTKTPKIVVQNFEITPADLQAIHNLYPMAQQAMRLQNHMPNRLSMLCSRRNCSYWRNCESEWGGEVPKT